MTGATVKIIQRNRTQRMGDRLQRRRALGSIHPWQCSLYLSPCFCSSPYSPHTKWFLWKLYANNTIRLFQVLQELLCHLEHTPQDLPWNPQPWYLASDNFPASSPSPSFLTKGLSVFLQLPSLSVPLGPCTSFLLQFSLSLVLSLDIYLNVSCSEKT